MTEPLPCLTVAMRLFSARFLAKPSWSVAEKLNPSVTGPKNTVFSRSSRTLHMFYVCDSKREKPFPVI